MKLSSKNWLVRLAFLGEEIPTESTTCDILRKALWNSFMFIAVILWLCMLIAATWKEPLRILKAFGVAVPIVAILAVILLAIKKYCPWVLEWKICRKVEIEK